MSSSVALIFTKFPTPGTVMTRMVPPLNHEQAAKLHLTCLQVVLENIKAFDGLVLCHALFDGLATLCRQVVFREKTSFSTAQEQWHTHHISLDEALEHSSLWCSEPQASACANTPDFAPFDRLFDRNTKKKFALELRLVVTPDNLAATMAEQGDLPRSHTWGQGDGDLGERLIRACGQAFDAGFSRVLLLGVDSPTLSLDQIALALDSLESSDASMIPSRDGGYCLLALGRRCPQLLEQIDWGTQQVANQTQQRAIDHGVSLKILPSWYDLDRFTDLEQALIDLERISDHKTKASWELQEMIHRLIESSPHDCR